MACSMVAAGYTYSTNTVTLHIAGTDHALHGGYNDPEFVQIHPFMLTQWQLALQSPRPDKVLGRWLSYLEETNVGYLNWITAMGNVDVLWENPYSTRIFTKA